MLSFHYLNLDKIQRKAWINCLKSDLAPIVWMNSYGSQNTWHSPHFNFLIPQRHKSAQRLQSQKFKHFLEWGWKGLGHYPDSPNQIISLSHHFFETLVECEQFCVTGRRHSSKFFVSPVKNIWSTDISTAIQLSSSVYKIHVVAAYNYSSLYIRVIVIEFWHGFIDCNYLSLNHQLIPNTITIVAYE